MGFFDVVDSLFGSLGNIFSTDNEFTCSQCLKCSQNLKTLSNGTQIKVYTCPCCDDTETYRNDYLDSLLPPKENGFNQEYKEKFIENYSAITSYISNNLYSYDKNPLYVASFYGDTSSSPVLNITELRNCYQAMECPHFRPYLKHDLFTDNEYLENESILSIDNFDSLSEKDKINITNRIS